MTSSIAIRASLVLAGFVVGFAVALGGLVISPLIASLLVGLGTIAAIVVAVRQEARTTTRSPDASQRLWRRQELLLGLGVGAVVTVIWYWSLVLTRTSGPF